MYTEGTYIYAEHNMALVEKATKFCYGNKAQIHKVHYLADGTITEDSHIIDESYFYEVVDHQAIREEIEQQITDLKAQLAASDYNCLKWVEGHLTDDEYQPIKEQRQELRDKINELENSL